MDVIIAQMDSMDSMDGWIDGAVTLIERINWFGGGRERERGTRER